MANYVDPQEQGRGARKRPPVVRPVAAPQDDLFAPVVPAARTADPVTSNEGIRDVLPRAGSQQAKLLLAYANRPMGLTADEAGQSSGLSENPRCGYWKRISELRRDGLISDTHRTRPGLAGSVQSVLAITAKGYAMVDQMPKHGSRR